MSRLSFQSSDEFYGDPLARVVFQIAVAVVLLAIVQLFMLTDIERLKRAVRPFVIAKESAPVAGRAAVEPDLPPAAD